MHKGGAGGRGELEDRNDGGSDDERRTGLHRTVSAQVASRYAIARAAGGGREVSITHVAGQCAEAKVKGVI